MFEFSYSYSCTDEEAKILNQYNTPLFFRGGSKKQKKMKYNIKKTTMVKRIDFRPFSNYLIEYNNNKLNIKKYISNSISKKYKKIISTVNLEIKNKETIILENKLERSDKMPKGIRILISGRINGVMKKRTIRRNMGRTWAQKFAERGEFKQEAIHTKWGVLGLSIWLRRKEEMNKKLIKSKNVIQRVRKLNKII